MGHSQASKADTYGRILAMASKTVREDGLESLSVNKLMQSVNLTHGGFYGHFSSRSDLLAKALERALEDGDAAGRAAADPDRPDYYAAKIRTYLSRAHRDSRKSGCAIAALAGDVARSDAATRAVMEHRVEKLIERLANSLDQKDDSAAMVALSAAIGAITLARVMTNEKRSDALLRAVRNHLLAFADE